MKICLDVSPAVHGRAGLGRYVQELATALLASDRENEYVAFYNRPAQAKPQPPIDALPRLTSDLPNKPWRMRALLGHWMRMPQDGLLPDVDLFHATDHLLPYLRRACSVFTVHDIVFRFHPQTHMPLNRWFLTLMMPRFLRAADAIIAVSEHTRRDVVSRYGIDERVIRVVYEGVSPRFRPASAEAVASARQRYGLPARYLLFVGTIEPRKNLVLLLEACRALKDRGSDLKLVVVGRKGWLYGGFFERLEELRLKDDVIFPGFIADEDLPALYTSAEAFVFPSLYEGFGLPILEAMACGAPVISSDTSSLPEVAGEAAILLAPGDARAWAEAIERVAEDGVLRAELRERGLRQAARFTWQAAARETQEVYRQAYAGRP